MSRFLTRGARSRSAASLTPRMSLGMDSAWLGSLIGSGIAIGSGAGAGAIGAGATGAAGARNTGGFGGMAAVGRGATGRPRSGIGAEPAGRLKLGMVARAVGRGAVTGRGAGRDGAGATGSGAATGSPKTGSEFVFCVMSSIAFCNSLSIVGFGFICPPLLLMLNFYYSTQYIKCARTLRVYLTNLAELLPWGDDCRGDRRYLRRYLRGSRF